MSILKPLPLDQAQAKTLRVAVAALRDSFETDPTGFAYYCSKMRDEALSLSDLRDLERLIRRLWE